MRCTNKPCSVWHTSRKYSLKLRLSLTCCYLQEIYFKICESFCFKVTDQFSSGLLAEVSMLAIDHRSTLVCHFHSGTLHPACNRLVNQFCDTLDASYYREQYHTADNLMTNIPSVKHFAVHSTLTQLSIKEMINIFL